MKIAYHLYELVPSSLETKRAPRQGALLRLTFSDGLIGYADCHPWPELGDATLSEQLAGTQETPLMKRAVSFARLDAEARSHNKNLFEGLSLPPSHFLIADLHTFSPSSIEHILDQGFTRIKIKVGNSLNQEIPLLKDIILQLKATSCKVRLDFNCKITYSQFCAFLEAMKGYHEEIDFCEDPFPFHPEQWQRIRETFSVSLACDRHSEIAIQYPAAADILVIKPAVQDEAFALIASQRLVVTSYLDHPLGQLAAAYVAAKMAHRIPQKIDVCGLLSHQAYSSNPFSECLNRCGAYLNPPCGTGFGFDALLNVLPWKE
jgi:o-succinylbenzoate synthase